MARGIKNGRYKSILFIISIYFCISCCMFIGCKSTELHDNGNSTTKIRDGISELEREELEATRIQSALEREQREIERRTDEIGNLVDESAENYRNLNELLQQIRKQPID